MVCPLLLVGPVSRSSELIPKFKHSQFEGALLADVHEEFHAAMWECTHGASLTTTLRRECGLSVAEGRSWLYAQQRSWHQIVESGARRQ